MHLLGNGMYNKSYHNEHMSFCHKMCNVVNTRFFMTISHFNENNDLGSSKALKWVLIWSSFYSKSPRFTQKSSLFPPMKRFLTSSPQSKIPGALGAIFGFSFLLEKVPISLKDGSPLGPHWVPILKCVGPTFPLFGRSLTQCSHCAYP